jgi:hypothetical protein
MHRHLAALSAFAAALMLALAPAAPVFAATTIADPTTFVRQVYARLAKGGDYMPPEDVYSARLAAAWADEEKDAKGEVGRVDFLFWINGQDGTPEHVTVKASPVEGNAERRVVVVHFTNQTKPQTLQFYFERRAGTWKLDDVVSVSPGDAWTLSVMLKYGWVQ